MMCPGIGEFGASKNNLPDFSCTDTLANAMHAVFKPETMRDPKEHAGVSCSHHHLRRLFGAHRHGFFAQDMFSVLDGGEHVAQVKCVGGSDKDGIDLGTPAEVSRAQEG